MDRYPEDLPVNPDDFRRSNWKAVLESCRYEGYSEMWRALSSAARQAMEDGNAVKGKALWLLADACSMMLNPGSINEPFKPLMVMGGRRTALPEDFQEEDVKFFAQIVEDIDDVWLRARAADLVWILQRPRDPKYALLAIDAYRMISLDRETWFRGGRDCWERAIRLTNLLRSGAENRMEEIEAHLIDCLMNVTYEDGFLALGLAKLMLETKLGRTRGADIAVRLEDLGIQFEKNDDVHSEREYFDASVKWFRKIGDEAKASEITVRVAETWVKEANVRMSSDHPSHAVAASFFEKAIQKYRSIPRVHRPSYKVDERIAELHAQMSAAGEKSLDEMSMFTSPSMDISELVENARNAVRGKNVLDALLVLVNSYSGPRVTKIRELSETMLREYPLQSLISSTRLSSDGRAVAKRYGMNLSASTAEENEAVVWAEMVNHYGTEIGLAVQGYILPALEVLRLEHRLREADFVSVAYNSPLVPPGREKLFGKALFAGYDGDFVSAIHLMVPQLEHTVRWHLKSSGVKTTTLDSKGIETEIGLSALMEIPETNQLFGENLAFEFKALFCDAFGPNLRNELAHGLLDYETCESVNSIYAWWLGLRIVINTFYNKLIKQDEPTDEESDETDDEK